MVNKNYFDKEQYRKKLLEVVRSLADDKYYERYDDYEGNTEQDNFWIDCIDRTVDDLYQEDTVTLVDRVDEDLKGMLSKEEWLEIDEINKEILRGITWKDL